MCYAESKDGIQWEKPALNVFKHEADPRNNYIARMEWAASSEEFVLQCFNRPQNRCRVLLGHATTGELREVLVDEDEAWVEAVDDLQWLDDEERVAGAAGILLRLVGLAWQVGLEEARSADRLQVVVDRLKVHGNSS